LPIRPSALGIQSAPAPKAVLRIPPATSPLPKAVAASPND